MSAEKKLLEHAQTQFSNRVIDRLKQKVDEGFTGWDALTITDEDIKLRLGYALRDGKMLDVAAFAMMLDYREQQRRGS